MDCRGKPGKDEKRRVQLGGDRAWICHTSALARLSRAKGRSRRAVPIRERRDGLPGGRRERRARHIACRRMSTLASQLLEGLAQRRWSAFVRNAFGPLVLSADVIAIV